jgi:hypothetical protein
VVVPAPAPPRAGTACDLAVEVREFFIPDFTRWKDHDAFEASFTRLIDDLKKADEAGPWP